MRTCETYDIISGNKNYILEWERDEEEGTGWVGITQVANDSDQSEMLETYDYYDAQICYDKVIKIVDRFRLRKNQSKDWVLHNGDVVINSKIWREIKKQLRGLI